MMGPILYHEKERDFQSLGMGVLADEIQTLVTEERNGQFYLEMHYPIDGRLYDEIKVGRLIKANASPVLRGQQFKVVRITAQAKGIARIYAEHVSNQTAELQLKPGVEYKGTAAQALSIWQDSIVTRHDFETHSDIKTEAQGEWDLVNIENARQALGGKEGSVLDRYKGEYLFDNYQIHLLKNRGKDNGLIIAYGKNLVDVEQEQEIASTYTSVMPYSTFTPERVQGTGEVLDPVTITLPEYFVDSDHADKFARRKIKKVDFSEEEINNVGELRLRAEQYIRENNVGVPRVNLRVQMLDLAKTEDYKDSAHPENIGLCDWVTVYFKDLGINQKVKVTKTIFNHTADRYEEIELGETRSNLSQAIGNSLSGTFDDIYSGLNTVKASADGKNKVFRGVDEPQYGMVAGDVWYQPIGVGEHLMYIYDGNTWGDPVTDNQSNREFDDTLEEVDDAIERAEQKIEDAREHTEEIEKQANSILKGLGLDPIGETHRDIVEGIKGTVTDKLGNLITDVNTIDRNVNSRIDGLADDLGKKPSKVYVSQQVDKAKGEITTVISGITDDPEGTIVGYNAMKSTVNGNVREIGRVSDKAGSLETKYNQVQETADMFTRTIGTTEAGIRNNVARIVMADNIFRTQVSNQISGMSTKVTQLEGSWALRIESNDELVSAINASEKGVYIKGKDITFDGEVFSKGDFTITGNMIADTISANKISGGTIKGNLINAVGGWSVSEYLYSKTPFGYTTLKPGGDVAIGISSPYHTHTTGAALQIWHSGRIRFGESASAIEGDPNNYSLNLTGHQDINLMPSSSGAVTIQGAIRPRTLGNSDTLGTGAYRWKKIYATSDSWDTGSDVRYKRNITDMPAEFYELFAKEVQAIKFTENGREQFGYRAQDVQRALFKYGASLPEFETLDQINAYVDSFGLLSKGESYLSLVYPQMAVIKTRALEQRVQQLEEQLHTIEERLHVEKE